MEENEKKFVPDYRAITLRTTDGSTIQGKVNVSAKKRVSDLFTSSEVPFIVLVEATLKHARDKTLFINKEHIVWVEPEEE